MDHILTLVSAGRSPAEGLSEELVRQAGLQLAGMTSAVGEPCWLANRVACDLPFSGADAREVEARLRETCGDRAIDLAAQPMHERRKRLLVADMESTVIANEMLDELGDFVGQRAKIEAITTRAMRGELDFDGAVRERVAVLEGMKVEVLERCLARVEIDPGASALVATMTAHGALTALVSGGFEVFVTPVGKQLGFDASQANELEMKGGVLTGRVNEPILGRGAKVQALRDYCDQLQVTPNCAVAVGDGANDLEMLRVAGLGVAFHAKPAVAAGARYRVDHGDLRTLLYFQGYSEAEIVDAARGRSY